MRRRGFATVLTVVLLIVWAEGSAHVRPGTTRQVDLSRAGKQPARGACNLPNCTNVSGTAALSGNGRYVAFVSHATDLVARDNNGQQDIFVRDLFRNRTALVSISTTGAQADAGAIRLDGGPLSDDPAISGNGNFVAFSSAAANLVPGDTNFSRDVFIRDIRANKLRTERVSVDSKERQTKPIPGVDPNQPGLMPVSFTPSLSADGRFVAFESTAADLVEGGDLLERRSDIFIRDRRNGTTRILSLDGQGQPSNGRSFNPHISPNGKYVAFTSTSSDLVPDDTNGSPDAFVRNLSTGKIFRVSIASDGTEGLQSDVPPSQIRTAATGVSNSGDVTFFSNFINLVPADGLSISDPGLDMFVHSLKDRRTRRISVKSTGQIASGQTSFAGGVAESTSANGRYVVAQSFAEDLAAEDGDATRDTYVFDVVAGSVDLVSVADDEKHLSAESFATGISGDGRYVVFLTTAPEARPPGQRKGDTYVHVFVRDRGDGLGGGLSTRTLRVGSAGSTRAATVLAGVDPAGELPAGLAATGGDVVEASIASRPQTSDLFVRIGVSDMPWFGDRAATLAGVPFSYGMRFETDSRTYELRSRRPVGSDAGVDFLLSRCDDGGCTTIGTYRGYYGTTGMEIVVSVPVAAVGLSAGGTISDAVAFSSLTGAPNPQSEVDELRFGATPR